MLNDQHYYCFVSFECFALFLHVLISLIKLILRLKFSTARKQAEDIELGRTLWP